MMPSATPPQIDVLVAGPVLAPAIGAVLVLALDALWPRRRTPALLVGVLALLLGPGAAISLRLRVATEGTLGTVCLPGDPALHVSAPERADIGHCLLHVGPSDALLQALAAAAGLAVLAVLGGPMASRLVAGAPHSAHAERGTQASVPVVEARGRPRPSLETTGRPFEAPSSHLRDRGGGGADLGVETALLLATVTGATTVAVAVDLGTWLVGLELATLPVVALAVLRGNPRDSGAVPLIMTSISSFGIAVVGAGLWVSATGSIRLGGGAAWAASQEEQTRAVLTLGLVLLLAALAFKLSLVPFHAWAPATYPRAGASVTMLLASVSAIAALGALIAVMEGAAGVLPELAPVVGVLAVTSMLVGAVLALRASDPLRLIAWSAVTQGGWVVAPLAAGDTDAAIGYLAVYIVAVTTVLAVVADLSPRGGRTLLQDRGLARRRPVHATLLGMGLLTLAGLPPGVAGLLAKFVALRPLADAGLWWIALPAVVAAALGFVVYLRWLALVLLPEDVPREPETVTRTGTVVAVVAGLVLLTATVLPVLLLGAGTR
ncbi:proton-conducting transporter membrane subunit [Janibacter cremeus]|uniref:NADH-quinone oxidoreductase subunit N n=1 Tax=Janibacter cremeus TaxID=1285192 RepID=A0A852VKW8_9MICO|nr:proton-conducting transporter membrane subunit [Janibacter cremeus]NYF97727.1 NADH-quinone oxidoreductase subunit N [Janibacter cremeus]